MKTSNNSIIKVTKFYNYPFEDFLFDGYNFSVILSIKILWFCIGYFYILEKQKTDEHIRENTKLDDSYNQLSAPFQVDT